MPARVYVTRVIPQPGIDLLRQHYDVYVNESDVPLSQDALRSKAADYDAIVTLLTDKIDRAVLNAGRGKLRIVANVAVGYDNIDVDAATSAGIMVSNTPGVLTETTADFAWTLLMATARRVVEGQALLRDGKFQGWGIMMLLGGDVHGKTLGLVGFGRIGQALARRATGFNMNILYYDPVTEADEVAARVGAHRVQSLEELLRVSDFVSLHTPLTAETHHLINSRALSWMKPSSYLINTARGPIVDEAALAEALERGTIAGAGLDVFEHEPEVHPGLLNQDKAVLTPHIASASTETRARMAIMAAENVIAALEGKPPPSVLNEEVARRSH